MDDILVSLLIRRKTLMRKSTDCKMPDIHSISNVKRCAAAPIKQKSGQAIPKGDVGKPTSFTKTPKRATMTAPHVVRPMTQPLQARYAASSRHLVLMSMPADKSDCHRCELGCTPRCGNSLLGVLSNLAVRIKRRLGHISNVDWLRVRLNHQITIGQARAIVAISQLASEME